MDETTLGYKIYRNSILAIYLWCIFFTIFLILKVYSRYIKREEKPFHIVVVDIEYAAHRQDIRCIEIPLYQNKTKYIALSYRWGEYQEQVVNTKVGYVAGIRGFHLSDFYKLCKMMTKEPDLKSIKYVWIDAICIDQNNYARRKRMIHEMSNIYKQAAYIVAVPDLHATYLEAVSKSNSDNMRLVQKHRTYLYHAITYNCIEINLFIKRWLDERSVPDDKKLRSAIIKANGMKFIRELEKALAPHDSPTNQPFFTDAVAYLQNAFSLATTMDDNMKNEFFPTQRKGDNDLLTPLLWEVKKSSWAREWSVFDEETNKASRFLADLIRAWSDRVWVISEYTIAKTKKRQNSGTTTLIRSLQHYSSTSKMKIWFTQLSCRELEGKQFFEVFFDADPLTCLGSYNERLHKNLPVSTDCPRTQIHPPLTYDNYSIMPYLNMISALGEKLQDRGFLQMVLGSKASKDVDRLHAILPLSPYKQLITDKNTIDRWGITSTVGLKLKLYEIMSAEHRLELLFLSCENENSSRLMTPTFATTEFSDTTGFFKTKNNEPLNIIMTDKQDGIKLLTPSHIYSLFDWWPFMNRGQGGQDFRLAFTPKNYHVIVDIKQYCMYDKKLIIDRNQELLDRLEIPLRQLDFVCIPIYYFTNRDIRDFRDIQLMGNYKLNRWILLRFLPNWGRIEVEWIVVDNDKTQVRKHKHNSTGSDIDQRYTFNIY